MPLLSSNAVATSQGLGRQAHDGSQSEVTETRNKVVTIRYSQPYRNIKSFLCVLRFATRTNDCPWSGKAFGKQLVATPAPRFLILGGAFAVWVWRVHGNTARSRTTSKFMVKMTLLVASLSNTCGIPNASTLRYWFVLIVWLVIAVKIL